MNKKAAAIGASIALHGALVLLFLLVIPAYHAKHIEPPLALLMTLVKPPPVPESPEPVQPPPAQRAPVVRQEARPAEVKEVPVEPVPSQTPRPDSSATIVFAPTPGPTAVPSQSSEPPPDVVYGEGQIKGGLSPLFNPKPQYPMQAQDREITGTVEALYVVGKTGLVEDIRIVKITDPVFRDAVLKCIKTWRFKPPIVDNRPARVKALYHIDFKLD